MTLGNFMSEFRNFKTEWSIFNQKGRRVKTQGETLYGLPVLRFEVHRISSDKEKLNFIVEVEEKNV